MIDNGSFSEGGTITGANAPGESIMSGTRGVTAATFELLGGLFFMQTIGYTGNVFAQAYLMGAYNQIASTYWGTSAGVYNAINDSLITAGGSAYVNPAYYEIHQFDFTGPEVTTIQTNWGTFANSVTPSSQQVMVCTAQTGFPPSYASKYPWPSVVMVPGIYTIWMSVSGSYSTSLGVSSSPSGYYGPQPVFSICLPNGTSPATVFDVGAGIPGSLPTGIISLVQLASGASVPSAMVTAPNSSYNVWKAVINSALLLPPASHSPAHPNPTFTGQVTAYHPSPGAGFSGINAFEMYCSAGAQ
jgi:hypothetical protein